MAWFGKTGLKSCDKCGDWKCPMCGSCLCALTMREKRIAMAYMATYENLLKEITGESYDFSRHKKVLSDLKVGRYSLVRPVVKK